MVFVASTPSNNLFPTSTNRSKSTIRVPSCSAENRKLKFGHSEDDNSDIGYLNFSILIPSTFFTILSFGCFIAAIIFSLETDYIPTNNELLRGFIVNYGSSRFQCNSSTPFPLNGFPSILNLFELNVIGNVLFRYSTCIPIVIRVFYSLTLRNIIEFEFSPKFTSIHRILADSMPIFTGLETFMLALVSIITVHEDFPEANRLFKIIFALTSVVNMLTTTIVIFPFSTSTNDIWDKISICLKLFSAFFYSYFMPQYIQFYQSSIKFPICHSYLPQLFALMEYGIILSFILFNFSILIDIRHISFICYPRSSSGECEPLKPTNFEKGAKYEYCRAFEYNQRRIMNI